MLENYTYSISDAVGNVGVAILMTTFLLLQVGRIKVESLKYNLLNGSAAALLLINLLFKPNLSGIIIEIWWLVLSVYGFMKVKRKQGR